MSIAEVVENNHPPSRLFITCEHADNHVPEDFELSESDRDLLGTHWGWDLGADMFVRALARLEDAPAVLSRFSRLICDPNRSPNQKHFIRTHIRDGSPIHFNTDLDQEEVAHRLSTFHDGYHRVVERRLGRAVERNDNIFLLSVHTFTPQLGDDVRDMEIGLLFDDRPPYVDQLAKAIRQEGFDTALNEPYSGRDNMIYSVERHASEYDLRFIEIEIRNDLLKTESDAASIAARLHRAFDATVLGSLPEPRV